MAEKVAIAGGGLGGLSAAAVLASKGYEVTLFEKNSYTGGKAATVTGSGFTFDGGPSLLTMPFILENLFTACGEEPTKYIQLKPLETICRYFYPSGTVINAYAERKRFGQEIETKTGESAEKLYRYLDYCRDIYDTAAEIFVLNDFRSAKLFFSGKGLKALLNLPKIDPLRSVHRANRDYFTDARLVQLFDRYATYNGSNPYSAPATLNIIPHVECSMGAYIPEGGIRRIPAAIEELAVHKGVDIKRNMPIEKIIRNGKTVTGVQAGGREYDFDFVISNADVNYTYDRLLNDTESREAKRYKKQEPSSSGLVFYWGIQGEYDALEVHNILFSRDYAKEFNELFVQRIIPLDPTVYIYISSKYNYADAPEGCSNFFVMINTPYDKGEITPEEIARARKTVINTILAQTGIDIEKNLLFEEILTPALIEEKTSSRFGSIYGISSNNSTAAFIRQANRSKSYRNLYFCGGSAHPGGGIPLVIQSGILAAEKVMEDAERGSR